LSFINSQCEIPDVFQIGIAFDADFATLSAGGNGSIADSSLGRIVGSVAEKTGTSEITGGGKLENGSPPHFLNGQKS
jgi:hypothetical protein